MIIQCPAPFAWRSSLAAALSLLLLSALTGCNRDEIDAVPQSAPPPTGDASATQGTRSAPDLVDVHSAAEAVREQKRPEHLVPEADVAAQQGTLTIRVQAGPLVPAGERVSVYLVDREHSDLETFLSARRAAPTDAWDPIQRFGNRLSEPAYLIHGELTLEAPMPARRSYVFARAGDLYGMAWVKGPEDGPAVVTLDKHALDAERVRVFRQSGKPAAGIKIRGSYVAEGDWRPAVNFDTSFTSGVDGVAVAYRSAGENTFVAQILGGDAVAGTQDDEGWRIDLPAMGTVRFNFPQGAKDATVHIRGKSRWQNRFKSKSVGSGGAEFQGVVAGAELTFEASVDGATAHGDVPPITVDDETIEVRPELKALRRIAVQLMRDGVPIPEGTKVVITVTSHLPQQHGSTKSIWLKAEDTDARGRSTALFDDAIVDLSEVFQCEVLALPKRKSKQPPTIGFPAIPVGDPDALLLDCGVLEMSPLPLLASGVVLDSKGGPIEGARVSVRLEEAEKNDFLLGRGGGFGGDPRGPAQAARATARTDAEGGFELRGVDDATEDGYYILFVRVEARGYTRKADVAFSPGATDLIVRLSASGQMRIDPGPVAPGIARTIVGTLTHDSTGKSRRVALSRAKTVKNVPAGEHTLDVSIGQIQILSIENLEVPEGGLCSDPRLHLNLEVRLAQRRIRIDPAGSTVATVFMSPQGQEDWEPVQVKSSEGWIEFACPRDRILRQFVSVPGRIPAEVTGLPNGSVVRLERLQKVTVRFEGAPPPESGCWVSLTALGPHRDTPGLSEAGSDPVDGGTATVFVPGPGEYECRIVAVERSDSRSWDTATISVNGPTAILRADHEEKR